MSKRVILGATLWAVAATYAHAAPETYSAVDKGKSSQPVLKRSELPHTATMAPAPRTSSLGALDDLGSAAPSPRAYQTKSDEPLVFKKPKKPVEIAQKTPTKKIQKKRKKRSHLAKKRQPKRSKRKKTRVARVRRSTLLERENRLLKQRLQDMEDIRGAERLVAGTDSCQIAPRDIDPTFDFVPEPKVDQIRERLKIVGLLLDRHGRAYDYRAYTSNQLLTLLRVLDNATGRF